MKDVLLAEVGGGGNTVAAVAPEAAVKSTAGTERRQQRKHGRGSRAADHGAQYPQDTISQPPPLIRASHHW